MKKICIAVLTLLSFGTLKAQNIEFGLGTGTVLYSGDLDSPNFGENIKENTRVQFSAFARYQLNNHFSLRFNYMNGKIAGADSISTANWQLERNLSFQSKISEVALLLEYNLFDIASDDSNKKWTIYGTMGVASLGHNPTTEFENRIVELQPLGTEGQGINGFDDPYSKRIVTFPMGGGLKYKISEVFSIQGELMSRFTFFDYLDDVSDQYVSFEELIQNGQLAAQLGNRTGEPKNTGDQRGTADVNDYYTSATLSLVIKFGDIGLGSNRGNEGCPYAF